MKTELFTPAEIVDMIDTLAQIRAEIAELKMREDTYKAALIAAEVTAAEGTTHRATISESYPTRTAWRDLAEFFSPSEELIQTFTTRATEPVYTLKLTARKVSK